MDRRPERLPTAARRPRGTRRADGSARGTALPHPYRWLETLHAGELASVYLAEGPRGRVALKIVRCAPDGGSENVFGRFLQEFDLIAQLDHPNVVRIYDLDVADDEACIAMEYLARGRLSDRIAAGVDPGKVVPWMYQIASALHAIHASGVLHRDLKPANILFRDDETLALIDFGLAKRLGPGAAITATGHIFGTPYYMSPEQGHAEPLDERSDIYSLGCIFYELLTGERPFTGGSALGVIWKHSNAPRPTLGPRHARFAPLVARMLATDPGDRPRSARALLDALARF